MIISFSWLKNHLSTKANIKKIVNRLTEIGLEVESMKEPNSDLDNFIICKVVKSQKHPNADKLKLCDIDIGSGSLVKVVCGAQNARDGLFAVYASPGSVIPKTNMKLDHEVSVIPRTPEILEIEVFNILSNPGNTGNFCFSNFYYPGNIGNLSFSTFSQPGDIIWKTHVSYFRISWKY